VAQKDLERLIKQRLDDRRKVINVFLNLESFNKVQDELESDRNSIEGTNRNPGRLTLEQRELESLQDQLKQYKEGQTQLTTLEEKVKGSKTELVDYETRFQQTDGLFKVLTEYDETSHRKSSLEVEVVDKSQLVENLNGQQVQLRLNKKDLELSRAKAREFNELPSIRVELEKAFSLIDVAKGLRLSLEQTQGNIRSQEASLVDKQKELAVVSSPKTMNNITNHWTYLILTAAFGAGSLLSFLLGQVLVTVGLGSLAVVFLLLHARQIATISQFQRASLTKEEQDRLTNLELVKIMEDELSRMKGEVPALEEKQTAISVQVLTLLRSIPRYTDLLSKELADPERGFEIINAAYQKDLQSQSATENKVGMLESMLKNGSGLKERLETAEQDLTKAKEKLATLILPSLPDGVAFSDDLLEETENQRDDLRGKVSRVKTQIEEAIARQREIKKFIEENKDIEEKTVMQEKNVALLRKELDVLKFALQGIEQTSESLRNRVKPQVERYMGLILPVITSGRYKAVQLDDDYTVRVFDPDAGEFKPKEVFSGGTEDQMLLAMRLAFALALMPQAKGRNPEFLFLDEPLGSSDRVRRDGILALMHKELSQNFKQIFLVSHVGDLEGEANSIIQMDNGTVLEVIEKKQAVAPLEVEVPA
jgi:DNA repair protein SbcC/Rad50